MPVATGPGDQTLIAQVDFACNSQALERIQHYPTAALAAGKVTVHCQVALLRHFDHQTS